MLYFAYTCSLVSQMKYERVELSALNWSRTYSFVQTNLSQEHFSHRCRVGANNNTDHVSSMLNQGVAREG